VEDGRFDGEHGGGEIVEPCAEQQCQDGDLQHESSHTDEIESKKPLGHLATGNWQLVTGIW